MYTHKNSYEQLLNNFEELGKSSVPPEDWLHVCTDGRFLTSHRVSELESSANCFVFASRWEIERLTLMES